MIFSYGLTVKTRKNSREKPIWVFLGDQESRIWGKHVLLFVSMEYSTRKRTRFGSGVGRWRIRNPFSSDQIESWGALIFNFRVIGWFQWRRGCRKTWRNNLLLLWEAFSGATQSSGLSQLDNQGTMHLLLPFFFPRFFSALFSGKEDIQNVLSNTIFLNFCHWVWCNWKFDMEWKLTRF